MDRPLDVPYRTRRIIRRILMSGVTLALILGVLSLGWAWLQPSVHRNLIRTALVDRGPMESTITASGTVLPELEEVISSPIDARVLKILKRPGDKVTKNDPIIQLDINATNLALEKVDQELSLKENSQQKTKLDLTEKLNNLQSQTHLKKLDLAASQAQVEQDRQLFTQGILAETVLKQAELSAAKAEVELEQLEAAKKTAEEKSRTEILGLDLEIKTLQKERAEASRLLELATTRADRDGVLTWVVLEEGSTIHKGDIVARIADLKSYRIAATVSDVHVKQLSVGQAVRIKINDDYLQGTIANILPTITNGVITLNINLAEKTSPLLHANLRTDVLIITDKKERTLRIKRGPSISGDGKQEVFVIRGDRAIKVPIFIGLNSFDTCEVTSGLWEGDEVIISDMRDYLHLAQLKID